MGLPSIENFDISFIRRTTKNLENYSGKYEFTMLLNCLLGLIVVPNEGRDGREFEFDFWSKKLSAFSEFRTIFARTNERVRDGQKEIDQKKFFWKSRTGQECSIDEIDVKSFLTRTRHSVAHFGIIPLAEPGNQHEWCGVILKNFREDVLPDEKKELTKNFEVCLMQEEIRTLANFISQKYLQTFKNKGRSIKE